MRKHHHLGTFDAVRRGHPLHHYAGIDVSLELSSVCIVDAKGKIVREAKVASDPDALVAFFKQLGFRVVRIGLEAGPLSQWLYAGLAQAGFETVLLETPHVKAALSAMTVKTDRKDARGIEISDWKSRTRSNVYSIKWISIAPIWRASKRPCGCLIRTSSPKHSNRHHRAGATTGFVRANVVVASMRSCVMQRDR